MAGTINGPDILVVDDNPNNLSLLVSLLEAHGFRPRPAINGQIALNAAFGRPPDLILLDVRMSGMDGYEVCRRLKAAESTRDVPVLFLSALENVEDKVKAFEVGGVDYITKPFQELEVLTRIKAHLALSRARRLAAEQAALEERRRLGRELHDSVTQSLASLAMYVKGWQWRVDRAGKDEVRQWLEQLGGISSQALKEMRLLLYQIDPAEIEALDLESAIRQRLAAVEERARLKVRFEVGGTAGLSPERGRELYAIATESLNNALKHAGASAVTIRLGGEGGRIRLEVEDDGCGFSPAAAEAGGGRGIKIMGERARRLGGVLAIDSQPGRGTRVRVEVPKYPHPSLSQGERERPHP